MLCISVSLFCFVYLWWWLVRVVNTVTAPVQLSTSSPLLTSFPQHQVLMLHCSLLQALLCSGPTYLPAT